MSSILDNQHILFVEDRSLTLRSYLQVLDKNKIEHERVNSLPAIPASLKKGLKYPPAIIKLNPRRLHAT
ncbi:Uncharacterised protein [Candidatus Venteria ishoeyi]|uniref:Uncharacterized protein n=1 Tax=Candidatus Venteria ishoeyi TaxID=1899563 RepID=A0A1H6F2E1_9GAMM|nr:Uncharacterised protein [Candidatus Venteria ishoeyi]